MLLEAKDIVFGYQSPILHHISLEINTGERIALTGPSGCGKSTLAQIMAGYLKPDQGQVMLDGKALPKDGYCPVQLIYQHPEKAMNPRWKLGKSLKEGYAPTEEFLQDMGIQKEWLNRYPTELSGGEMQRFSIARAMGPDTKFILADEISTMLDVVTQVQMWDVLLKNMQKRNLGLLVVTHNIDLAQRIATKVISFEELQKGYYHEKE